MGNETHPENKKRRMSVYCSHSSRRSVTSFAQRRREAQLAVLVDALRPYAAAIVAGDYNYDPVLDAPDPPALRDRFIDVWSALRGAEPGLTFDAQNNPTAAITSKTAKRRRYDRVCVTGATLRPLHIALAGRARSVAAGGGLCPSDHYAVAAHVALPGAPPMRHYDSLAALMAAQARALGDAHAETARRHAVAARIAAALGAPVDVVGSTAIGAVLRDSDLDCVIGESASDFGIGGIFYVKKSCRCGAGGRVAAAARGRAGH